MAQLTYNFEDAFSPHVYGPAELSGPAYPRYSGYGSRPTFRGAISNKVSARIRVAIGVGSRGIANIATIVRAVVAFWKDAGMKPFIFPAMGSHGAATAEGQADVLAHYDITEQTMGCPIVSSLEVVSVGHTPEGIETFIDKNAFDSDGVMLVGRVKWHTDFAGKIESGLFKMMAIGLGKFHGAQRYHTYGYNLGMETVIIAIGRQVLKSGKILGGLAILEDANHNTAQLTAVPVDQMEQREVELLAQVKQWMGHLPVSAHILILDQIGKPISGAGFDTKVGNRGVNGEYNPWPNTPKFHRFVYPGSAPEQLREWGGIGNGGCGVGPATRQNRLDTHVDQLAYGVVARGGADALALFN